MKKRMFITTIVMMLVLAVALTTSSLAWFSSANETVTASSATFTAATAGTDNVNLKIGDEPGSWSNTIALTNGGRTLAPMVPTAPLIPAEATDADPATITTTGVSRMGSDGNPVSIPVTHKFTWPARMSFNGGKINASDSKFVIEASGDNRVLNYGGNAVNNSTGYYYDEFYLLNADQQNTLSSLTFKVSSNLSTIASGTDGYQAGDYTARGYVAFILFDAVNVAKGSTVPSNALQYAGLEVVSYDADTYDVSTQVKETALDKGLDVWVPFAGFTFCTKKGATDTFKEADWQFADLDAQTTPGTYDYNGALTTSLPTQHYDALTGIDSGDGFVLNTASLRALNNKVIGASGSVDSTRANADTGETGSTFVMQPTEVWRVAMYYWLDGQTLTEFTDTTVSTIGLTITAAR